MDEITVARHKRTVARLSTFLRNEGLELDHLVSLCCIGAATELWRARHDGSITDDEAEQKLQAMFSLMRERVFANDKSD